MSPQSRFNPRRVMSVKVLIVWAILAVVAMEGQSQRGRFLLRTTTTTTTTTTKAPSRQITTCTASGGGSCANVTNLGGTIQSPNFPASYGTGVSCVYNIGVPSGYRIQLVFTTLIVRSDVDILTASFPPVSIFPEGIF